MLCYTPKALGNGVIDYVQDIVYVKPKTFDALHTPEIAAEIGKLNERLLTANRPCLLIGPGRWGSSTPALGIPVNWGDISAARIIAETTLDNYTVELSQGSHFFQNLVSFGIAYLTIDPQAERGSIDWDWLDEQPADHETGFIRHVHLPHTARSPHRRTELRGRCAQTGPTGVAPNEPRRQPAALLDTPPGRQ